MTKASWDDKNLKFLSFPLDKEKLIYEGTYYFKLQFAPEFKFTEQDQKLAQLNTGDVFADFAKVKKAIGDTVTNLTSGSNVLSFAAQQQGFKTQIAGALEATANAIVNQYTSALQQFVNEGGVNKPQNMEALYTGSKMEQAVVFLPLNSMRIERKSGVAQTQGVHASVQQAVAAKERQTMESGSQTQGAITARGLSENPFLGHTMSGVDFESYNLEWELIPRNQDEMAALIQILTYFNGACLANLNLNNRNNVKWTLPPVCEMGILVSSWTESSGTVQLDETKEWKLQELIDARVSDIESQDRKNRLRGNATTVNSIKSFWLKPPVNVFVSNLTIEPLENKGGVLLSPEGFPMGVKLNVTLLRTALATIEDLFRASNMHNMGQTGETSSKSLKRANPFS